MYQLSTTKQFDKALKRCQKRGYSMEKIKTAMLSTGTHSDTFGKTKR